MKKMLDVDLTVKSNVVLMQINYQDDRLRTIDYQAFNGIRIKGSESPGLVWSLEKTVFLQGADREKDQFLGVLTLNLKEDAYYTAQQIKEALEELNRTMFRPKISKPLITYGIMQNGCNVVFTIYDQIELPEEYAFIPDDKDMYLEIKSEVLPELDEEAIYLRGTEKDKDHEISIKLFDSPEKAEEFVDKIHRSIRHWQNNFDENEFKSVVVHLTTE